MFVHMIEYNIKVERKDVLLKYFEKDTLPVLKTAPGFLDITLLHQEDDVVRYITVCHWQTKEHCVKFVNEVLPRLIEPIRDHLVKAPVMINLLVDITTIKKVVGEAA